MAQANTSAAQLRLTYALLRFAFHWTYAWQSRLTPISGMHRSTACVHISNICNNASTITARLTITENTVTILCDRGKSFHFVFIANSPYFSNIKLTASVLPSSTCRQKTIHLEIEGEAKKDWRSITVYIVFALTVLLWVLDKYTGVNSNVVAMLPVGVFCIIGVITRRDLEEISWGVLWMVAGGFALGVALNQTGLATHIISSIPFDTWSPVLVIIGSGIICYAMANFISHTATANLLVPILAVAGGSMSAQLAPLGGVSTLLIGVAIASSLGMVLPISTPPNAMAHATGLIEQKDMAKVGIIMGLIGLVFGYIMLIILGSNGFIGG